MAKSKNSSKSYIRLFLLFLIPGAIILTGVYTIQTNMEKSRASQEITEMLQFVKEQCTLYDTLVVNDKTRRQMDLIEKVMELKRSQDAEGDFSEKTIKQYMEEQNLQGIAVLDKDMNIIRQVHGQGQQMDWGSVVGKRNGDELISYPNKVVSDTAQTDKESYYYAATGWNEQILVCYKFCSQGTYEDSLSINNILAGYRIDKDGLVILSDGTTVISSNDKTLQGKNIEECSCVTKFNSNWAKDSLVQVKDGDKTYFGQYAKCGKYYAYVFYPQKEIFRDRGLIISYTIIFYLCCWFLILIMQRMSEKKLIDSAEEARNANAAKTEFLRRMSHDIRTPINGILGMLNIGDHFPEDMEKQKECRDKIRSASVFLFELVNDVLDMSKMESGEIELEHVDFDLKEMLKEVTSLIEVQAVERGLKFEFRCQENCKNWKVNGSPIHLRQILTNIAGNAVKYNKEKGSIELYCRELENDGDIATFEFRCVDTGKGMSKEFQKHMFEPFTQEESGARTTLGGTGLGLSIVQKLVEKMNGEIKVDSEEGKGTIFSVIIPLKLSAHQEGDKTEQKSESDEKSIAGVRILMVEDNALNMEIAEFMLENEGAVVTKAWNGKEAVERFENSEKGEFDLILMDIMMPVMDGLTAVRKIRSLEREDAAEIPVIAMTANAFEEDRKRSRDAGMNGHLAKPLDIKEVKKVVSQCIK